MSLGEPSRGVRGGVWHEGETERGLPRSAATKQLNQEKASRASLYVWSCRIVGCSERWVARRGGMHVLDVTRDSDVGRGQGLVVLDVESDADLTGCPDCGVVAVGHGRHVQVLPRRPVLRHSGAGAVRSGSGAAPNPRVVEGPGPRSTTSRRRGPSSPAGRWSGPSACCGSTTPQCRRSRGGSGELAHLLPKRSGSTPGPR